MERRTELTGHPAQSSGIDHVRRWRAGRFPRRTELARSPLSVIRRWGAPAKTRHDRKYRCHRLTRSVRRAGLRPRDPADSTNDISSLPVAPCHPRAREICQY